MNWITLTEPHAADTEAEPRVFHIRADTIRGIYQSDGETVVRLDDGGQVVCSESADRVLTMVRLTSERRYTIEEIKAVIASVMPLPHS